VRARGRESGRCCWVCPGRGEAAAPSRRGSRSAAAAAARRGWPGWWWSASRSGSAAGTGSECYAGMVASDVSVTVHFVIKN
jgi:hypothetical protein